MSTAATAATPQEPQRAAQPLPITTLVLLCFLGQAALTIYLPSVPAMAEAFSTSAANVQLLVTAFMVPYALALPFIGPVSDRFGRRPMIMGGALLLGVSSFAASLAPSIEVMYVARAFQGIGACCCMVLPRAMIRDIATGVPAMRALTYTGMALSMANIIAPVIGTFFHHLFGWQGSFYIEGAAALATFFAAARLPESARGGGDAGKLIRSYAQLLRIPRHMGAVLSFGFGSAAYYSFISVSPTVYIDVLGLSRFEYSFVPMTYGLGFLSAGFIGSRLLSHIDDHRMIVTGNAMNVLAAGAMVAMAVFGVREAVALTIPIFVIGFSNGVTLPRSMTMALTAAPLEIAGAASAMLMFGQYVLGTLASLTSAAVANATPVPMAGWQLFWLGLALIAYLAIVRPPKPA